MTVTMTLKEYAELEEIKANYEIILQAVNNIGKHQYASERGDKDFIINCIKNNDYNRLYEFIPQGN